jgi:exosortase/archaeosortase family protein
LGTASCGARPGRAVGGGRRRPLLFRATLVAVLVVVAYQYSLGTLLRSIGTQTPLAYLGLVPMISLLLVAALLHMPDRQRDIHDRYLDYIVGLPLVGTAVAVVVVGPATMSTFFWLWRIDLLSLPLFVAGAIALAFGVRMLWRLRVPVAFLVLAWPPPYTLVFNGWLDAVTNLTLGAVHLVLRAVPLAVPLSYGDGSLFQVTHAGQRFVLSVASACGGVNSVLGFLLVGAAAVALVRGPRLLRAAWLGLGMVLIWSLDVVRILLIFASAQRWGEGFALNVLHPFVGLVFFACGVSLMMVLMRRFGLGFAGAGRPRRPAPPAPGRADAPGAARRTPVPHAAVALMILAAAGSVIAVSDTQMSRFSLLAQGLGPPRVEALTLAQASVPGWSASRFATYAWGRLYFGSGSSWVRYVYTPRAGAGAAADAALGAPVFLDVVTTPHLGSLGTYTVQDCYHFHDYTQAGQASVSLGGGVTATEVVYTLPSGARWTSVYWEWPVATASGHTYQRIVLQQTTAAHATSSERSLLAFARQVVSSTGAAAARAAA